MDTEDDYGGVDPHDTVGQDMSDDQIILQNWTRTDDELPEPGMRVFITWKGGSYYREAMLKKSFGGTTPIWRDVHDNDGHSFNRPDWWMYVPYVRHPERLL